MTSINFELLEPEIRFATSRSGGKGGQNVNKVETKVELRWDVARSGLISEEVRSLLLERLRTRLTGEDVLILTSQEERTQEGNKRRVVRKLDKLLESSLAVQAERFRTRPTFSSVLKRLKKKESRKNTKEMRRKPDYGD